MKWFCIFHSPAGETVEYLTIVWIDVAQSPTQVSIYLELIVASLPTATISLQLTISQALLSSYQLEVAPTIFTRSPTSTEAIVEVTWQRHLYPSRFSASQVSYPRLVCDYAPLISIASPLLSCTFAHVLLQQLLHSEVYGVLLIAHGYAISI